MKTTIEWNLASKKLPEKSGTVLIMSAYGDILTVNYSAVHHQFNNYDDLSRDLESDEYKVIFWAKIPDIATAVRDICDTF